MHSILTKRELEVGHCLIHGLNRQKTAEKLNISSRMVKEHETKIRKKLNCTTQYQTGYQLGLILFRTV